MKVISWLVMVGGVYLLAGCTSPVHVLGQHPDTSHSFTVAEARTKTGSVTLQGTMVEKCPTAACWFRLKDKTGVVRVDVREAYFTVADVPLNSKVTVSGHWQTKNDTSTLTATGMTY